MQNCYIWILNILVKFLLCNLNNKNFSACYLQEQNTVPSLRKALKDIAMEKDAAVVARVPKHAASLLVCCSFDLLLPYNPLILILYRRIFQHSFAH